MHVDERPLRLLSDIIVGSQPLGELTSLAPPQQVALCRLACEHGLGPYLYSLLKEHDGWEQLTQKAQQPLITVYGQSAGYNYLALEIALSWQTSFNEAGIEPIWLKGLPLGVTVYPSLELRPMVDIDVLIRRCQLSEALALVEQCHRRRTRRAESSPGYPCCVQSGRFRSR